MKLKKNLKKIPKSNYRIVKVFIAQRPRGCALMRMMEPRMKWLLCHTSQPLAPVPWSRPGLDYYRLIGGS